MNTITINFIECATPPENGYNLKWRVLGSGDPYTDEGNFTSSPAVFTDSINPPGTCYEGILQSDCTPSGESGTILGNAIAWATPCESGTVTDYTIELTAPCSGIYSNYLISGGMAGDIVTVKAQYSGILIKNTGSFARADLSISSPDGSTDNVSSACYQGLVATLPHNFSISAQTTITMTGATALVTLKAVSHNSAASYNNVIITITTVNGINHNIFIAGCDGDAVTPGDC